MSHIFGRPNLSDGHRQELFPRISVMLDGGGIDCEKGQRFCIKNPHRARIALEKISISRFALFQRALSLGLLGHARIERKDA